MGYTFISYSSKNRASADAMRDLLKSSGVDTWMAPGDIPAGSKYAQVINRAVKECACMLLMLSKDAQDSIWVAKEVERAVNYRKPIIPVQIEDVILNDEFELYISTDQVVAVQKIYKESDEIKKVLRSVIAYSGVKKNDSADTVQASEPTALCVLVPAQDESRKIELQTGSYIMGRSARKSHIIVDDVSVSGVHAVITVSKDECAIQDLNTTNGSYLNGSKIVSNKETALHDGDIIRLGAAEFTFHALYPMEL